MEAVNMNRMIAEFMGATIIHKDTCVLPVAKFESSPAYGAKYSAYELMFLDYDKSWDWLMPVIEKCFATWEFKVNEGQNRFCGFYSDEKGNLSSYQICVAIGDTPLEAHYRAVIEYIELYNKYRK